MDRQYLVVLENFLSEALGLFQCLEDFLAFAAEIWKAKKIFPNLSEKEQKELLDSLDKKIHSED